MVTMTSSTRRVLPALLAGVLLLGLADSMAGPYLVLFGANRVQLSPFEIGLFVSVNAVSGIVISTVLGRRYDRRPGRGPALVAVAIPVVGYLLLPTTRRYPVLLVIAAALLSFGTAAFPQLFTLARGHLSGAAATRGTPALRSAWSLAWAVGPLLGAALLAWRGYAGLFLATAAAFALVAVPLLLLGRTHAAPAARSTAAPGPWPLRPVLSFALFHVAMFAGSVVLPLYVTKVLGRSAGDVGLLFSVCAIAEIPAALALLLVPDRVRKYRLILGGLALFVIYFALIAGTGSMAVLIAAQVARGVAIAVVSALGITYFQDLMPQAPGRATTLYANTTTAGLLVSGVLAGSAAQLLGYRAALVLCGALAAAAAVLLAASGRENRMTATATGPRARRAPRLRDASRRR